ncbi:glutathione S-transferase C-terminal domain-containing protein-like [Antedon mediterranea]|uniref:glutathione S-transferase C-terminal domain-containing protein-like n=1 Tax=Antedon mediterranea TaxID=105859 RepID=UPI003AF43A50
MRPTVINCILFSFLGNDILKKTSFESENLYLEGCHENLTIRSRIVIFVLNYCKTDNDIFRVFLCDPSVNKTTSTSPTPLCILNELKCERLKSEDIPDVVLQSKLPAILSSDRLLCSVGLCIVLRKIVRQSHNKSPERNLIALLGHQQSCLRGFAEGSSWTKYCEIELPADVDQCFHNKNIPTSILKFEKCLSLPVRISNRKKHQRILKKSMSDRKLKEEELKGATGVSLSASTSVDSKGNSSCSEMAGDILKHGAINCSPKPSKKPKVISEPEIDINSDSSISDNTSKPYTTGISKKQCTTSKPVSEEFLPQLEHIFAEGINMSLIDLVVFPCVHLILHQAVQSNQMTLFWRIPLVLTWYRRMWDVKEVKNSAKACKMTMVTPMSKVIKSPSNHEEMEVELDAPNTEGTGMKEAKPVSKRGMRMGIQRKAATLLETLNDKELVLKFVKHPSSSIKILWDQLQPQVHPAYGDVPGERSQRKCQQIENIVAAVKMIAKAGDYVVDFCSGGGHLGIVLAAVLPDCHIILVESKEVSIIKGLNRVKELELKNVTFYLGNIDYYHGKFDIGVSLHACGVATDMVITRCIQNDASFVSSPCCYGAVRDTHVITYPRSKRLREKPLCFEDYRILAHAAEHTTWDFDSDAAKQAKSCMACIDSDRLFYSMEHGYQVWMTTMEPFTCTPKNNLLIGVNKNRADKLHI